MRNRVITGFIATMAISLAACGGFAQVTHTSDEKPKTDLASSTAMPPPPAPRPPKPMLAMIMTPAVFTEGIEGPAVDIDGNLYAVNYDHQGSIGVIRKGETVPALFLDLPAGSISSGLRFGANNVLYATDYVKHHVFKIDIATRSVKVFAQNAAMNQPNDLALMSNGILFASDPNWGDNTGKLWRIGADGVTVLLASDMGTTNGIEVSPDNKTLYVNESVQRTIWKFNLDAAGNISNKTKFKEFSDGGLDGMRTDRSGNLYVARYGKGSILVLSPEGETLREIKLNGVNPTNITFSRDYKKAYVTIQDKGWIETFDIQ